jgi:hypothetical protein
MKADELSPAGCNQSNKQDLRMHADPTSNLGDNPSLGLGAIRRRRPGVETQDIEQGFAAHVAQHDTQRESGDRRAKHHQHTYIEFHNGPSEQSFCSPFVRRVRTCVIELVSSVCHCDRPQRYVDPRFYCRIRYI